MNTFCYIKQKSFPEVINKTKRQKTRRCLLTSRRAGRPYGAPGGLVCLWLVEIRALASLLCRPAPAWAWVWHGMGVGLARDTCYQTHRRYGSVDARGQLSQEPRNCFPLQRWERGGLQSTVGLPVVLQMSPATGLPDLKTSRPCPAQKPALEKCPEGGGVGRGFTGHQADRKDAFLPASLVILGLVRDTESICQDGQQPYNAKPHSAREAFVLASQEAPSQSGPLSNTSELAKFPRKLKHALWHRDLMLPKCRVWANFL